MKTLQFPLSRVTLLFICGILFAHYAKPRLSLTLLSLSLLFAVSLLSFFFAKKNPQKTFHFGIIASLLSLFCGVAIQVASVPTHNPYHYMHQLAVGNEEGLVEIKLTEKLKATRLFDRYIGNTITLNGKKSYGKILLNIRREKALQNFSIGSRLKTAGTFSKNKKPNNPDQFDYGEYLENQGIYGQFYTHYSQIENLGVPRKSLFYYADRLRNTITHNLEKNHFSKTELAVIAALILGQQQDIPQEVIRDYQYAGAVHILSVSGLHVGLILLFVTFLLKPIPNTRKASFIKLIIILFSLWGFGILAGLAPSVVRSVTMFSFVAVGMFLRRSTNIYHTLLVSVLLILLFRPSFLFDVGFQLSYTALFFIVWLQPFLATIWQPRNKIAGYFWNIITVSFAAQIGTLPLSIYYFHQFPGLFFITNLIVLPMLGVILGLGVVVMVLATFNCTWLPLLKVLEWSVWLLNKIIAWVASFEDFIFRDIPLNGYIMLLLYLLIFTWLLWLMQPTYRKLVFSLIAVTLFQSSLLFAFYSNQQEEEFIVFHCKKHTLITERKGRDVVAYDGSFSGVSLLKPYLTANFGRLQKKEKLSKLYCFKGKKILLLDSQALYKGIKKPDVLVLTHSPKLNLERLLLLWKPGLVVADGSNYRSYVKRWKATCRKEKIPFHDTAEKGFYKL